MPNFLLDRGVPLWRERGVAIFTAIEHLMPVISSTYIASGFYCDSYCDTASRPPSVSHNWRPFPAFSTFTHSCPWMFRRARS